jgi:hypothetical protein
VAAASCRTFGQGDGVAERGEAHVGPAVEAAAVLSWVNIVRRPGAQSVDSVEEAPEQLLRHGHLGHLEPEVAPHRDRYRQHGEDVGLSAAVVAMTTTRTVSIRNNDGGDHLGAHVDAQDERRDDGPAAVLLERLRRDGDASGVVQLVEEAGFVSG